MTIKPICLDCTHLKKGSIARCSAFKEIPFEILTGENDHSKPLKDQKNEIVFEEIK